MNTSKNQAFLRTYPLKIAAGAREEFGLRGSMLRIISSNVTIFFEDRQGGNSFYLEVGEEVVFNAGKENVFYNLDVFHNSGVEQTIVLAVGENARIGSAKVSGLVQVSNAIDLSATSLAALESVDLNAATRDLLRFETYGASYRSTLNLAANTAETVFTGAANVNGAIIHSAQFFDQNATASPKCAFLAKATAPASVIDGDAILSADGNMNAASHAVMIASLKNPLRVPAGKGLFFITDVANTNASRSVLYTLL